jgi:hypothetical protein
MILLMKTSDDVPDLNWVRQLYEGLCIDAVQVSDAQLHKTLDVKLLIV